RCDDWLVCKSPRSFPQELMHVFSFNLILFHAGFDKFQYTSEPFLCDVHSALHELEFTFRLHAAQSVHDWRKTRVAMQRIFAPAPFDESHVAALHLNRCAVMLVGIEIYLFN